MSDFRPCKSNHAIEQAVVGVRISKIAPDDVYKRACEQADVLAVSNNLPGKMQLDPMALFMGRQVISPGYAPMQMGTPGMLYQRVAPNGTVVEEITLERSAITYRTHKYNRWDDVVRKIQDVLIPLANTLCGGDLSSVSVVELRCIDRFMLHGDDVPSLSNVIRSDSPYISSNLLDKKEMLHQHIGWFESTDQNRRTLLNINIDSVNDSSEKRNIIILQVISEQGKDGHVLHEDGTSLEEALLNKFHHLHERDKEILSSLLTDEKQSSINLNQ
ncbi:TIGR04255 family protein [Komagataeibacter sp. AV436]|uniref:TIGR04255 family protein n=1 Tax=Komagataeibacter melomenusus TaxID=2766578 RepID=A0ABX2AFG9_9PROT|nr:TIGR04255 family protein [Komagataeibacter melomenusus]MBV1831328.1 TIGR04255 family protein [Komagataeibacter melomenusus]NPC67068.1 TIGR04255 family protein [Komagataeibacter melomenusus]